MLVPSYALLNKLLTQSIQHAVAGPFSGCLDGVFIGLSVAPTTGLTPSSVLAAIHEATFTGYARQAVVWHPPYIESGGAEAIVSSSTYWTPTDGVTPNTITGMFLADALTNGNLLASEQFAVPQPLAGPSNAFSLSLVVQLLASIGYGFSTAVN